MAWKAQRWNQRAESWKDSWPQEEAPRRSRKDKGQAKQKDQKHGSQPVMYGHDGKPIEIDVGGTTSSSSSVSSSSLEQENRTLREALRTLVAEAKNPESIPAGVRELTVVDPREDLRMRQRELNKEKKALTKVEKIRSDIEKNESSYSRWKQGIHSGLEKAEKRHTDLLHQLQTDLKLIEAKGDNQMEDGSEEEEESKSSKALVREVDEMKAHMGQMATYVQRMEQRNWELAQKCSF